MALAPQLHAPQLDLPALRRLAEEYDRISRADGRDWPAARFIEWLTDEWHTAADDSGGEARRLSSNRWRAGDTGLQSATVNRLLGFISPWALAAVAVWIVVMGVVANWAIPVFANVGTGPGCVVTPCGPNYLPTDWFPVLATGFVVASIMTAVLVGVVLLARRVSRQ